MGFRFKFSKQKFGRFKIVLKGVGIDEIYSFINLVVPDCI